MIEGIQIINPKWQYVYVNDTLTEHGKYSRKELIGYTMMDKYPGIEHTEVFAHIKKCMLEGQPHQMVNEFDFPNGSKGYFELRMQPVLEGVLVLSFDVTAQKQAEKYLKDTNVMLDEMVKQRTAALELKNKELEQFAYIASHDLQEPLRTVSNYIKVFEEDYVDQLDEEALSYLKSMAKANNRMTTLVRSLLDYSRLGRDKKLTRVDIGQLVSEVLSDLQNAIKVSGATFKIGILPILNVYETEIRQLFQNLIINALKFRKQDESLSVEIMAEPINDSWRFSVCDNGIGIAEEHFDRIFQIFQRLHLEDAYEGNGIGLAYCKKIVELHQGLISVTSTLGKGSTFMFTVPNLKSDE